MSTSGDEGVRKCQRTIARMRIVLCRYPIVNMEIEVIETRETNEEVNTVKSTPPDIRHGSILEGVIGKA